MRLYDSIFVYGTKFPEGNISNLNNLQSVLAKCENNVFSIDNVADYFYNDDRSVNFRQSTHGHGWDAHKDFPIPRPPFDDCFIEFKPPLSWIATGAPHQVGAHFMVEDFWKYNTDNLVNRYKDQMQWAQSRLMELNGDDRPLAWWTLVGEAFDKDAENSPPDMDHSGPYTACAVSLFKKQVRWVASAHVYLSFAKRQVIGPMTSVYYPVAPDGSWVTSEKGTVLLSGRSPVKKTPVTATHEEEIDFLESTIPYIVYPMWLAISFMHARRTRIHVEPINEKLARAFTKRHKREMVRIKTLSIFPARDTVTTGSKTGSGRKMPLHMVRGHFKRYDEEAPLFGKHKGLWWWGPMIRGDDSEGVLLKDYAIEEPVKEPHG